MQCSDIRRGGGNRVQHVVASIGTRQARTGQGHRLAAGHVLVAEGGRAARQTNRVRADCAAKTARRHRGGVVAVVLFAVRREAARDVLGSDVGSGRPYRVQHVIASVGPAQARACQRHRLAVGHCLVVEGGRAARQTNRVRADCAAKTARQHRRRVIAVIDLVVRRETTGDVLTSDNIGDRRGGDVVVVGGARERPGVAVGGCNDMCRAIYVNGADNRSCLAAHARDRRDGGGVRLAIIRQVVRRDHHGGGGLPHC